jgi:WASH complex subunit strumpellin
MRETVDKHFSENWIITIYMGYVVDLSEQWKGYKSAKKALDNVLTSENIGAAAQRNLSWFHEATSELAGYLTEGTLNEQFVLLNMNPLIDTMRKANVTVRWRLLHRK